MMHLLGMLGERSGGTGLGNVGLGLLGCWGRGGKKRSGYRLFCGLSHLFVLSPWSKLRDLGSAQ